jgi:hypothetical protein
MRVWGKDGMTWPNIVAGGSAKTKASMAHTTERLGHPFATVTLTVGAHGLLLATGVPQEKVKATGAGVGNTHVLRRKGCGGGWS